MPSLITSLRQMEKKEGEDGEYKKNEFNVFCSVCMRSKDNTSSEWKAKAAGVIC